MSKARDIANLSTVEIGADVTDTDNVTSAGALMDTEITNLADVKSFDPADYATAAQGTLADSALQSIPDDYLLNTGDSITGNLSFGDNDKAIFGAGSDLQIYHNGAYSIIQDSGVGNLAILGTDIHINNSANNKNMIKAVDGGSVSLYYDNSKKLATTSTGIDVTGTATMDGLTVDGDFLDINLLNNAPDGGIRFNYASGTSSIDAYGSYAQAVRIWLDKNDLSNFGSFEICDGASAKTLLNVKDNGDISFYEATGTTAKFFWDASAERLGIGTSSPTHSLTSTGDIVVGSGATSGDYGYYFRGDTTSGNNASIVKTYNGALTIQASELTTTSYPIVFNTDPDSEAMRLDSSGNLLVGTTDLNVSTSTGSVTGTVINSNGQFEAAVTGSAATPVGIFNKLTNDGDVVAFRKNGTTVGSIGAFNGDGYIGNGDVGFSFADGGDSILPVNTSTPAYRTDAISLGNSSYRFKDLYLSGGVVFGTAGGTVASKTLDDYEEGTWTPALQGATSTTYTSVTGRYVKVGSMVTVLGKVYINTFVDGSDYILAGLPFTPEASYDSVGSVNWISNAKASYYFLVPHAITSNTIIFASQKTLDNAFLDETNVFQSGTAIHFGLTYKTAG